MSEPERSPLLVVGWDGVELRRLRWLLKSGHLPNLRRLAKRGRDGDLVIGAPLTPSACWTTLMTGVPALEHDVLTEVEPDGQGDLRPVLSTSRHRPALWNHATAAGVRGAYVGFPASAPAEPVRGVMISDRFCEQSGQAGSVWPTNPLDISPADRFEEFRELVVRPAEVRPEEVHALIGDARLAGEQAAWLYSLVVETLAVTSTVHNLATSLLEEGGYQLSAVRYRAGLTLQRALLGVEARTLSPSSEMQLWANGCVHACYGLLDLMLGRLLELVGEEANVLVVSNLGYESEPRLIEEETLSEKASPDSVAQRRMYDPHRHFTPGGTLVASGPSVSHGALPHAVRDLDLLPTAMTLLGCEPPPSLPGAAVALLDEDSSSHDGLIAFPSDAEDGSWSADLLEQPWNEAEQADERDHNTSGDTEEQLKNARLIARVRRLQNQEQALTQAGKHLEALEVLHRLRELQDSMYVRVRIAECYLAMDDMKRAGAVIGRLKQLAPDSIIPTALEAYGRSLRGQHEQASGMLRELLEQRPESPHLWLQYGCSLLAEGDHAQAKDWFQRALRAGSHRWLPHWGLAQCHQTAGEHGLAQHHFGRCLDLGGPRPDDPPLPLPTLLKQFLG